MTGVVLRLCEECGGESGALAEALATRDFAEPVHLESGGCMNGCAAPVSMALQGTDRATYFFSGVDPATDIADILATVGAYIEAPGGWIADARRCGRLRLCLVGRVPAL